MTDDISEWTGDVHQGDAAEVLQELPSDSVHCVVTSPPYYQQRDYGCDDQLGLEDSLNEYLGQLLDVTEEIQRVLRPEGSFWLNIGDKRAGSGGGAGMDTDDQKESWSWDERPGGSSSLPRKSKMNIPARLSIALQDQGWVLRDDVIWEKTNAKPESVKDRYSSRYEHFYRFTPNPMAWFNLDAVRDSHKQTSLERERHGYQESMKNRYNMPGEDRDGPDDDSFSHHRGKNPGDVWEISTASYPDSHFAVFPRELVEPTIQSTCPPKTCECCGQPYVMETHEVPAWELDASEVQRPQLKRALEILDDSNLTDEHLEAARAKGFSDGAHGQQQSGAGRNTDRVDELAGEAKEVLEGYFRELLMTKEIPEGWRQDCDCDTSRTRGGIVLDPFAGTGTALEVAKDHGRRFIGIDLSPEYVAHSQRRLGHAADNPEYLLDDRDRDEIPLSRAAADGGGDTDYGGDR